MTDWTERAACRDEDPELFFPVGEGPKFEEQVLEARTVCRWCDVAGECLGWAMDSDVRDGIWGGTTPEERRGVLREQTAASADDPDAPRKECGTCHDVKPLTEFHFRKRAADGYESRCKSCNTADRAVYRAKKKAAVNA